MDTPKRLYEVLPAEKRMIEPLKLVDVLGKVLLLQSAEEVTGGDKPWYKMKINLYPNPVSFHVSVNQEQITSILKYLNEQKAYPVLVKVITAGNSYAMVDPEEYGTTPKDDKTSASAESTKGKDK